MEVIYFALKALIVLMFLLAVVITIAVLAAKASQKPELEVEPLHKKMQQISLFLKSFIADKQELKAEAKEEKKKQKQAKKSDQKAPKIYVLEFIGDIKASHVTQLREEVTAILQVAKKEDEVVVKVESPGGVVHGYGLAASQLLRIREKGIHLTVCIDKVAASGGYLMACVAEKILAAPFAIVGSIGVVAQVPNFYRALKKYDIDYKEYTAGEYKRTVSLLGEITPKGEAKFLEQLEDTHSLFKKFVNSHRPQLNLEKTATGEYWYGDQAIQLGLVDKIQTSDDYILSKYLQDNAEIFSIKFHAKQTLSQKISEMMSLTVEKIINRIHNKLESEKFQ
jgi:serine protease SohB